MGKYVVGVEGNVIVGEWSLKMNMMSKVVHWCE